jgi:hypothetical protein
MADQPSLQHFVIVTAHESIHHVVNALAHCQQTCQTPERASAPFYKGIFNVSSSDVNGIVRRRTRESFKKPLKNSFLAIIPVFHVSVWPLPISGHLVSKMKHFITSKP